MLCDTSGRKGTPAVLSLDKLCKEHGYTYEWPSGREARQTNNGNPLQNRVLPQVHPRHRLCKFFLLWIQQTCEVTKGPRETVAKGVAGHCNGEGIPEWLEGFTENLESAEVPAPAETSHDSDLGRQWHHGSTVFFSFPASEPKITRAPCRRRPGDSVLRADKFGDLISADHTVLNEGCESRNNHRHSVVVQG